MATASPNLAVMIAAARKAARRLVRDFGEVENLQVSRKGAGDFVSNADRAAENTIREELTRARPAYGWLGEETAAEEAPDGMHRWIVDPLDGTTNFLHGLPHWAISIALERKGEIVAGVIFDPVKDEMFTAEKGAGAWMNDRRMRVSGRRDMAETLYATGVPIQDSPHLGDFLKIMTRLMPRCSGVRRFGAAALDLAYVAAGRYDGFWERGLKPWDCAAGVILVREAGGVVRDIDVEGRDPVFGGATMAANPEIADAFQALLRGQ